MKKLAVLIIIIAVLSGCQSVADKEFIMATDSFVDRHLPRYEKFIQASDLQEIEKEAISEECEQFRKATKIFVDSLKE